MPDVPATVTQASPLRVRTDGSSNDCPAVGLNGAAYTLGQRVTVTTRNPTPPLVLGEESDVTA